MKNDLANSDFKGRVKSVTLLIYRATGDLEHPAKGNLNVTRSWKYNEKGNLIERRYKSTSDSIESFDICKYDSNENLLQDSGYGFKFIFIYDAKGNRVERDLNSCEKSGKAKRLVTEIYKVDELGNQIEKDNYYDNKDSLYRKTYFKYNQFGLETEKASFGSDGKPLMKEVKIYDGNGNQIEYQMYEHDTLKRIDSTKYNNIGKPIERGTYRTNGELVDKWTSQYDDKGNQTESETIVQGFDNITRHQSFDKEGNWHRSVNIVNGKPSSISEMVIEYYP